MLHPLGKLPKHIHLFWAGAVGVSCRGSLHPLPATSRSKCQRGPTWEKPTPWHLTGQRQCHTRPEALTPDENTMACSLPADAGRAGRYGPRFLLLADSVGRRLSDSSSSPGTSGV
ncbi:hypothetical protein DPX16_19390 [Anabarilius grahami]|uniref:Uncharacterized protein n=1 Tax=Anabarilius grahami TaxID=495550 RepID=A0A3N0Z0R7_ANAGA|nr:hypothetical protein DPX16_19390 [Anabarilius grahami]